VIGRITLRGARVTMTNPLLKGGGLTFGIPDVDLRDVGKRSGGVTAAQAAAIVTNALLARIAQSVLTNVDALRRGGVEARWTPCAASSARTPRLASAVATLAVIGPRGGMNRRGIARASISREGGVMSKENRYSPEVGEGNGQSARDRTRGGESAGKAAHSTNCYRAISRRRERTGNRRDSRLR